MTAPVLLIPRSHTPHKSCHTFAEKHVLRRTGYIVYLSERCIVKFPLHFLSRCVVFLFLLWANSAARQHLPHRDPQLLLDANYCESKVSVGFIRPIGICSESCVVFLDCGVWKLPHRSRLLQCVQHGCRHALPLLPWVQCVKTQTFTGKYRVKSHLVCSKTFTDNFSQHNGEKNEEIKL